MHYFPYPHFNEALKVEQFACHQSVRDLNTNCPTPEFRPQAYSITHVTMGQGDFTDEIIQHF